MNEKELPTINLKGHSYVQVKDRVAYFNEQYKNGSIITEVVHSSTGMVTFKAIVTPDLAGSSRFFTGHSFGTTDEVKAFEKLESVAVGRALAMMGIGIVDSIASADEMDRFNTTQSKKTYQKPIPASNVSQTQCSCGGTYTKKEGKYGPFLSCSNYPECKIKAPKITKPIKVITQNEINAEYGADFDHTEDMHSIY